MHKSETPYEQKRVVIQNLEPNVVDANWDGNKVITFGLMGDTQFGSKYAQITYLHDFYNLCADKGKRNFNWKIEGAELADRLVADGWNVKIKPPREEGDKPFMHLAVKVNFEGWNPPNIYLVSGNVTRKLDADTVGILDDFDIIKVNFDIRAYDYDTPRGSGRAAYLHAMQVFQRVDRFSMQDDVPFDME